MDEQKIIKKQLLKNMILNFIAFTLIFSILGIVIYTSVKRSLYKSSDNELLNNFNRLAIIEDFKGDYKELINNEIIKTENMREPPENDRRIEDVEANPRLVYIFRDENGDVIEEKGNYSEEYFENINFDRSKLNEIYEVTVNNTYLYRAINYKIEQNGEVHYVQLLINVDAEESIIDNFTKTLILSIVISIILSIIASYILSKKTLKPIVNSWKKQSEFVQNASHELRTPLTIIQAKQELLLEEPNSKIVDKAGEINIVLNETRRLSKLVKDLMQLARADSNKTELNKENIETDIFIEQITEPFKEFAKEQEKEFVLDLNCKKNIYIDKNKMHQVMVILLDNALKYTEKGDKIEVKTFQKDNKVLIDIIDTGIGISDEGLKNVFDRFYREDKARSRQTGGSGLGLSIAKFIIDAHKGTIIAKHNEHKGTIFEIKL